MATRLSAVSRLFLLLALVLPALGGSTSLIASNPPAAAYIVQATSVEAASHAVQAAGGRVSQSLGIINSVVATLDGAAVTRLGRDPQIHLYLDLGVQSASNVVAGGGSTPTPTPRPTGPSTNETDTANYTLYAAALTRASLLHTQTITTTYTRFNGVLNQVVVTPGQQEQRPLQGWGVTVAIVDSGLMKMENSDTWFWKDVPNATLRTQNYSGRGMVYRDFLPRSSTNGNNWASDGHDANSIDQNGHGTHIASTISDYRPVQLAPGQTAAPAGVAPDVNLMVARALDRSGMGTYSQVIAAIDWIVANKTRYNVRVLNLSICTPVSGPYWSDPLNQAVMRAWQAGLVVVTAAGNVGPGAGTITVPGNVPYVITVGALKSGRYTASTYDELANYSSRGPTESAFVKPDVVVPASRTIAAMPSDGTLSHQVQAGRVQVADVDPDYDFTNIFKKYSYYQLSGTSMAAAEVSGVVALMAQANPTLSNDQIKYRLLATARPALKPDTTTVYSVWEQGAGLVEPGWAVFAPTTGAANTGMDIAADLTTTTHYWGNTIWNSATGFQLVGAGSGSAWAGSGSAWAGSGSAWAGSGSAWAGGTSTWAASESLWAGSGSAWAGSVPNQNLNTASHANLLTNDP